MRVTSEGPTKITKATIDTAWRRKKPNHRLIVRDKDCRGLALTINATTMTWSYAYRPRGTDPVTGRRWPNRTVTLLATRHQHSSRRCARRGQSDEGAGPLPAVIWSPNGGQRLRPGRTPRSRARRHTRPDDRDLYSRPAEEGEDARWRPALPELSVWRRTVAVAACRDRNGSRKPACIRYRYDDEVRRLLDNLSARWISDGARPVRCLVPLPGLVSGSYRPHPGQSLCPDRPQQASQDATGAIALPDAGRTCPALEGRRAAA